MNMTTKCGILTLILICGLATLSFAAQQPMLLGMETVTSDKDDVKEDVLLPLYEKSAATAIIVQGKVKQIEIKNKADNKYTYTYDFSEFDTQPFLKSKKIKICRIDRGDCRIRDWRDVPNSLHPPTLEDCALALAQHANSKGITVFWVPIQEFCVMGQVFTKDYTKFFAQISKGVKAASAKNIVIAEVMVDFAHTTESCIEELYTAGCRDMFDWIAVRGSTDISYLTKIHAFLSSKGDSDKKIFLRGWGKSYNTNAQRKDSELRDYITSGYRTLTTKTGTYDPSWVAGAFYYPMNDYYSYVSNVITQPSPRYVSSGGLVDINGKPKEDLLDVIFSDKAK